MTDQQAATILAEERAGHRKGIIAFSDLVDIGVMGIKAGRAEAKAAATKREKKLQDRLDEIADILGQIKYTDMKGGEEVLVRGPSIPDDGKRDYVPKCALHLCRAYAIAMGE